MLKQKQFNTMISTKQDYQDSYRSLIEIYQEKK